MRDRHFVGIESRTHHFKCLLPADWRHQWHAFVADQATKGYKVNPKSVVELEQWIEAWARFCGLLPIDEKASTAQSPANAESGRSFVGETRSNRSASANWGATETLNTRRSGEPPKKWLDWPRLTPDEKDRINRESGWRWWYPFVPAGETDWIWISKLEGAAQSSRFCLMAFYNRLGELGRTAKSSGDPGEADLQELFAKQQAVQSAYDEYVKSLIELEEVWIVYLQRVIVMIGVHVSGLKEKIDRALPLRIEGFESKHDSRLKDQMRRSAEALRVARGRVEGGYAAIDWADRIITVAQFVLPVAGAVRQVFQASVKKGLSTAAALTVAIAFAVSKSAVAAGQGLAALEVLPRILHGLGIDEADARAGITIFVSLVTLKSAIGDAASRGPSAKLNPKPRLKRPPLQMPDIVRRYWVKFVEFEGVRVYQRDDLIDPRRLDPQGRTSLQLMKRGNAPVGSDGKPINLITCCKLRGHLLK